MLLRASGEHTGETYDLQNIHGRALDHCRVPYGKELIDYADAYFADDGRLGDAGDRLRETLGAGALVDAAGVVAIFNAVVRIADATGIPLEDYKAEISVELRSDLGINDFPASRGY